MILFRKTQVVTEKTVRVKDPLNVAMVEAHTKLLTEHRALLNSYAILIETLRSIPHYANPSETPLYLTDEEEDAQRIDPKSGRRLSAVPDVAPNPFADLRADEAMLQNLGLHPNIDFH